MHLRWRSTRSRNLNDPINGGVCRRGRIVMRVERFRGSTKDKGPALQQGLRLLGWNVKGCVENVDINE